MPHADPPAARQRHPRADHGCGPEGQFRPPGHADGHGGHRRGAVARYLKHNPANPHWADRDRFVLSNGHGSMLLYSLLHLTGYPLTHRRAAAISASSARTPPAIPRSTRTSASRPPPVRSARASPMPSAWRWPRRCWPRQFNRPGHDDRRPPHLGVPRRRLPDGRHLARGLLAGRHAALGKLICVLRRQRHLHRRRGARLVHRRHAASASRPTAGM